MEASYYLSPDSSSTTSDKMDMPLDNIIVRVEYRGESGSRDRRSGGIGPIRYRDGRVRSRPVPPYSRARDIAHHRDHCDRIDGTKLFLSNLDSGIDGDDINDLFCRFGHVREGTVHYNGSGESLGTGTVTFERRADAIKAMQHHDNVRLDDRPVTMEMISSAPSTDSRGTGQNRRSFARRGGRGLRGGGRGRVGPTTSRRPPTAQELDAELDARFREREELQRRNMRRVRFGDD